MLNFLLLLYLVVTLLLYVGQQQMLYFPTEKSAIAADKQIMLDVNGQQLQAWRVNPGKPQLMLYFGGNAEAVEENISEFSQIFPSYTLYLIAYRGYGASTGSPSETALNQDALAIYDKLVIDYKKISVMGRSLGSGVAVHLSANRKIDKTILVTPFDSILNVAKDTYWMFPLSILLTDKFESWRKVQYIDNQSLLLIAEQDEVIPARYGKNLARFFSSDNVEVAIIKGAGHNTIGEFQTYKQTLIQFAQK